MDKENDEAGPSCSYVKTLDRNHNKTKKPKKAKRRKPRNNCRYFQSVAKMINENDKDFTNLASKISPKKTGDTASNSRDNVPTNRVNRKSIINNMRLKRLARRPETRSRRSMRKGLINANKKDKDSSSEQENDDNESLTLVQSEQANDDEDCIILENKIEQIVIEDDDDEESVKGVKVIDYEETDISESTKNLFKDIPVLPYFEDKQGNLGDDEPILIDYTRKTETIQGASNQLNDYDGDVIFIDDTVIEYDNSVVNINDSSCIVLDDTVLGSSPTTLNEDFIPLGNMPNPKPSPTKTAPSHPAPQKDILSRKERQQLNAYSDNTYNPNPTETNKSQKRMVIIDGSNVAFAHGLSQSFSVKGLKICIEYFEKLGHEVKAIVPMFRQNYNRSTEPKEVARLHKEGKVIFTPCKNIPGLHAASYDDRFILQLACQMDAAIISNDCYRDMIDENSAFKKIIENRVIGYTWCNDVFILPKDPYGRLGPTLREILNRY